MTSLGKATVKGESGNEYRFQVFPLGTRFRKASGIYLVTYRGRNAKGRVRHKILYIGQTEDLSQPFEQHRKAQDMRQRGANCICVQSDASEESCCGQGARPGDQIQPGVQRLIYEVPRGTMFRHVLCVFPYPRTRSSKTSFPPLGLEYVAAALRPYAERIELVNFRHQRVPGTQPFLRPETDLVCYSINWPEAFELIRRDINALPPGVTTILGGRTATENPRYWLDACPNVDAVVCGDGEQADCRNRLRAAVVGNRRPGVPRRGRPVGVQSAAAQRAAGRRLDARPRVAPAAVLPYQQGREHGDQDRPGRRRRAVVPSTASFAVSRINPWGVKRRWTPRSPDSIVREIEQIDADLIMFVDDVFTHQPERVVEICDLLIAKGIRKNYIVNARLEIADRPDVLRKMERAGFIALLVGVESTQDATLKSMGKGFTIAQVRQRFQVLRKSKMVINAYFIVGNIGETEEQMLSTASFARSLGADLIHVSRLRCEPHTGLRELVAADARIPRRRRRPGL